MITFPLNIIPTHEIHICYHPELKDRNEVEHIKRSILSVCFTLLSNPQVHAADGKCPEYRSVWSLSDYAGHNVLRCIFCSHGTV